MKILAPILVALVFFGSLASSANAQAQGAASLHLLPKDATPIVQLAACIGNGSYCSSDAECCSHRCYSTRNSTQRCVGKKFQRQ
jgi:hypothetical protein